MLAALARDRVVSAFVASYVAGYDRRGILGGPARDRELADTIGREIVLALILETRDALPRFFGKQQAAKLKPEQRESIEAFMSELVAALGRAQNWSSDDRRQFRRDLAMYTEFRERPKKPGKNKSKQPPKPTDEEPPFVARVALLLDPSMLEQARRAARKFYGTLPQLSRKLLRQTLG